MQGAGSLWVLLKPLAVFLIEVSLTPRLDPYDKLAPWAFSNVFPILAAHTYGGTVVFCWLGAFWWTRPLTNHDPPLLAYYSLCEAILCLLRERAAPRAFGILSLRECTSVAHGRAGLPNSSPRIPLLSNCCSRYSAALFLALWKLGMGRFLLSSSRSAPRAPCSVRWVLSGFHWASRFCSPEPGFFDAGFGQPLWVVALSSVLQSA